MRVKDDHAYIYVDDKLNGNMGKFTKGSDGTWKWNTGDVESIVEPGIRGFRVYNEDGTSYLIKRKWFDEFKYKRQN